MQKSRGRLDWFLLMAYALLLHPIIPARFSTVTYLLLYGLPLFYMLLHLEDLERIFGRISQSKISIMLGISFLLTMSMIVPILLHTNDLHYVNVILAIFRKMIILCALLLFTANRKEDESSIVAVFMEYYILTTCIYVFGTCVFVIVPSLKAIWINMIGSNDYYNNLYASYGYGARFGWSGFSGYRNTLDCTISIIFALSVYENDVSPSPRKDLDLSVRLLVCLLGNLFYGRTGIAASMICILIWLVFFRRVNLSLLALLLILTLAMLSIINIAKSYVPIIEDWYNWATRPFLNFLSTGSFNNY